MKPTNDLFEQQVRSLYEGYEVPSPSSTKDAVFNELDSSKHESFASNSLLIAASLLTVGAIYMIFDQPAQSEEVLPTTQIEEVVAAPEEVVEELVVEVFEELVEVEDPVSNEDFTAPVKLEETIVAEDQVNSEDPVVAEESAVVVEEIKEVAQPVEIVKTEAQVVKEQEVEEKKEDLEWVLPAKIKVEK